MARSPVVSRRELGALLRDLRVAADLTVEQVADRLLVSPSKISRLETGQRGASLRDIRDLCELYEVDDQAQRDHLAALAREGRRSAWWQQYSLPYANYVGLEAEATLIRDFEPGVFPGLLQIPDYVRAIHESGIPKVGSDLLDERIEERRRRQEILGRGEQAPRLQAVIDEAVLHRVIGGPEVMGAQIDHVVEACESPNITVQVIPFTVGAHPALDSTFTLLEFEDPVPGIVYVEGLVGWLYLDRPQDVQRYAQVFDRLCAISLSEQKSLDAMKRMSAAYEKA